MSRLIKFVIAFIKGFLEGIYLIVLICGLRFKCFYLLVLFAYQSRQIRNLRALHSKLFAEGADRGHHIKNFFDEFPHYAEPNVN